MTEGKLYFALQAVVCVAVVVFMAVSAVGIYREGSARTIVLNRRGEVIYN